MTSTSSYGEPYTPPSPVSPLNSTQLLLQSLTPNTNLINFLQDDKTEVVNAPDCSLSKDELNAILVNSTLLLIKSFYPSQSYVQFKFFLKEILRRSKTSTSVLQISLYYLIKMANKNDHNDFTKRIRCPKKLLLMLIILASKFNQDKNYSFKSWSKISGLAETELIQLEKQMLVLIDYELYINHHNYENWCNFLIFVGLEISNGGNGVVDFNQKEFDNWYGIMRTMRLNELLQVNYLLVNQVAKGMRGVIEIERKKRGLEEEQFESEHKRGLEEEEFDVKRVKVC